jgi:hypothetical protein
VLASAFVASVAGLLGPSCSDDEYRVTLHRVIQVGDEILLQQACPYRGRMGSERNGDKARTFGVETGTIGLAFRERLVVRTAKRDWSATRLTRALQKEMGRLQLNRDSSRMSDHVTSVLAIPFVARSKCILVLYAERP